MSYDARKKVTLGQVKTLAQAAAAGGGGASPTVYTFAAGDWTNVKPVGPGSPSGGGSSTDLEESGTDPMTITLTAAQHGRSSGNFVYQVYSHLADGTYKSGTWDTAGVGVRYLNSGKVELSSPQAFAGKIVFL